MAKTTLSLEAAGKQEREIFHADIIGAAQAKAHLLQIIESVRASGRSVVVTRRGKPTVQIVPVSSKTQPPLFGRLKGIMQFSGDIVSPDLETWESET